MRRLIQIHRKRGFTCVELMMVIAIITLLAAILLPAISNARETARRSMCRNNMMQIGLALHNYHDAHRLFPPGTVNSQGPVREDKPGQGFSWIARILPFLEKGQLFRSLDFHLPADDPKNLKNAQRTPAILGCPSSSRVANCYVGVHHHQEAPIDVDNTGVLFLNSSIRYDDIPDGRRSTLLIGEAGDAGSWSMGTRATLRNASPMFTQDQLQELFDKQPDYYRSPDPLPVPDAKREDASAQTDPTLRVGSFSSQHLGGCNFVLCDGSLKFLSPRMDQTTFQRLAHRSDGNLIRDF
ncbi:MAG: DUF1559 domain-containing protein [Planctomycetaceae bacterium]|nr:DUF1559 domain-containing protein [Planctomycetaceae bacterium]